MKRISVIISLFFISYVSFSQENSEILSRAILLYKNFYPKIENKIINEFCRKSNGNIKRRDIQSGDFKFVILLTYKLHENFVDYINIENFEQYLDFEKVHRKASVFVFKDSIYQGYFYYTDYESNYFSSIDTNCYNKNAFKNNSALAKQILSFDADLCFFPDCPLFLCFIKDGTLYIGKSKKQLDTLEYILPFKKYIQTDSTFIMDLKNNKEPTIKHYLRLI